MKENRERVFRLHVSGKEYFAQEIMRDAPENRGSQLRKTDPEILGKSIGRMMEGSGVLRIIDCPEGYGVLRRRPFRSVELGKFFMGVQDSAIDLLE